MQIQRHYSKAPITEAVIDLKVTLTEGISVDKLKDIHPYISEKFPTIEPFYRGVGAFSYQPGSTFQVNTSQQQIGFWFRSYAITNTSTGLELHVNYQ